MILLTNSPKRLRRERSNGRRRIRGGRLGSGIPLNEGRPQSGRFFQYKERLSRPIAKAIVRERALQPIETTRRLADIVARVVRGKPGDIHPATRTFQALRIAVNEELAELEQALAAAERILKPGGRLVVVTFHSLEDRIVKQFLGQRSAVSAGGSRHAPAAAVAEPTFTLLGRKAVAAGEAEAAANPRARSAKLRAAVRTGAPAREARS
ncbi:Ribosomal RNA small subunit methyltransferase H [bacterium YEK0313]|nr:Ribosomal RNA small subunit methyltransferase H [bacterium YEK0313]